MESGNQKKLCLNEPNNCYKKGNQAQNIYYLATIVVVTKLILAYSELIVLPKRLFQVLCKHKKLI